MVTINLNELTIVHKNAIGERHKNKYLRRECMDNALAWHLFRVVRFSRRSTVTLTKGKVKNGN